MLRTLVNNLPERPGSPFVMLEGPELQGKYKVSCNLCLIVVFRTTLPFLCLCSVHYPPRSKRDTNFISQGCLTFRKTHSNLDFSKLTLPPPPQKISGMVIFQQIQISKYPPPPDFSGSNGFLHVIFSIRNRPLSGLGSCEMLN